VQTYFTRGCHLDPTATDYIISKANQYVGSFSTRSSKPSPKIANAQQDLKDLCSFDVRQTAKQLAARLRLADLTRISWPDGRFRWLQVSRERDSASPLDLDTQNFLLQYWLLGIVALSSGA
jgi:hypothetical protein